MASIATAAAGPLNPFESAFELMRALQSELHDLKDEIRELKVARDTRYEKIELDVDTLRSSMAKRFERVEAVIQEERQSRTIRCDQLAARAEEVQSAHRVRVDHLDAQLKAEMNIRFEQTQALDRKLRGEAAQLRALLERTGSDLEQHRQKVEADTRADRQGHEDLRLDVEKLAALLSDSSLTRDPFNQLGYRPATPTKVPTDLGSTSNGSSLPPLLGSNVRIPSRAGARAEGATTARAEGPAR
eukprot:CAMPEP_0204594022 /NCGR_PEP_ID=MMETSP0661-20131031/51840_1 /ASSEMBLY_ACC=CAM_ASM_000606 /TAXON_ID=109239 /ORGANISM="Alexandrium margalefi, Strain AMGDE01CS-322" /LENGTH=243 /DNA_ID=CAMNT_0051604379 /DNA_START=70 /DNA_END=801 /DNA_ORIENTATION=-